MIRPPTSQISSSPLARAREARCKPCNGGDPIVTWAHDGPATRRRQTTRSAGKGADWWHVEQAPTELDDLAQTRHVVRLGPRRRVTGATATFAVVDRGMIFVAPVMLMLLVPATRAIGSTRRYWVAGLLMGTGLVGSDRMAEAGGLAPMCPNSAMLAGGCPIDVPGGCSITGPGQCDTNSFFLYAAVAFVLMVGFAGSSSV